jgi:hypothetical protein
MIRKRWIYPAEGGEPYEVSRETLVTREPKGPMVFGDLPDYESPIDGHIVSGRVQRREDLKRNGCRPWEGKEQEQKEAQRRLQYHEQAVDSRLEESINRNLHQLRPDVRRVLLGR